MRRVRVSWLLVPLAWAMACGGKFEESRSDDGEGDAGTTSTGQGGSAPSRAGTTSRAGTSSAGGPSKSTGGTGPVGSGGFAAGGGCACDAIACGPGYQPVLNPDGCCFHCEPNPMSCEVQQKNYQAYRSQLIEKYSSSPNVCSQVGDCALYYQRNACGSSCGIPIAISLFDSFMQNLDSYAKMTCDPACAIPEPPCPQPPDPVCSKGGYCR